MNSARNYIFGSKFTPLLLDFYTGAAIAYSLRKLRAAYFGNAIRVRRSSDNVEMDIGFLSDNTLDTSTLISFIGANSGSITTWYDQSGNGKNLTQTTSAEQPLIISSGTLITRNSKVSIRANLQSLSNVSVPLSVTNDVLSGFVVAAPNSNSAIITSGLGSGYNHFFRGGATIDFRHNSTTTAQFTDTIVSGTQLLYSVFRYSSSMVKYYRNNAIKGDLAMNGTWGTREFSIGKRNLANGNYANDTYFQEIIYYSSDKISDISGIHSNINTYYSIY